MRRTRARTPLDAPASHDGRRPRVLAHLHMYVPQHMAGAETMAHSMLRALASDGWDVRVIVARYRGDPYVIDGVRVQACPIDVHLAAHYEWADVVVTHLDATRHAAAWSVLGRPLVHLIHNHRQIDRHKIVPITAQLVVWNSEWLADPTWTGPSIVVRPPTIAAEFETVNPRRFEDGTVTQVNISEAKGGSLFWKLAAGYPKRRFVGVRGAYAGQTLPPDGLPNTVVVENTPAIHDIYENTRVLCVPSSYESWGKAAVEALASGIPVIAHPTEGLVESLGEAGIFVDRDDTGGWVAVLDKLEDRGYWQERSDAALERSRELDAVHHDDLDRWRTAMLELAHAG